MQILFIHQNIPGQFKHLIAHFASMRDVDVWALGEAKRVRANWPHPVPGVNLYGYVFNEQAAEPVARHVRTTEVNIRRGLAVVKSLESLKSKGLSPDVLFGHPGWGEMLFIRDVFPNAKIVNYCEFYFNSTGQDLGFDPEFPERESQRYEVRAQNMTQTQSLLAGDLGISPTHWQRSRYPELFRKNIEVIFDGVDCNFVKPDREAAFSLGPDRPALRRSDEVVTFVNRNLEPLRGFHKFMRALPELQKRRPKAQIVIVGGDGHSYSPSLHDDTYRERYWREIEDFVDRSRIHFVGNLPYGRFLNLLQISTVHIYLSYPFVLSWSVLEAMAAGCAIVASDTEPVREVIKHNDSGILVDFFDQDALVSAVEKLCADRDYALTLGSTARGDVGCKYDLQITLPKQIKLLLNG